MERREPHRERIWRAAGGSHWIFIWVLISEYKWGNYPQLGKNAWKNWRKQYLVLTQGWEFGLFPPTVRLEKLIIHRVWLEYSEGPCLSTPYTIHGSGPASKARPKRIVLFPDSYIQEQSSRIFIGLQKYPAPNKVKFTVSAIHSTTTNMQEVGKYNL